MNEELGRFRPEVSILNRNFSSLSFYDKDKGVHNACDSDDRIKDMIILLLYVSRNCHVDRSSVGVCLVCEGREMITMSTLVSTLTYEIFSTKCWPIRVHLWQE